MSFRSQRNLWYFNGSGKPIPAMSGHASIAVFLIAQYRNMYQVKWVIYASTPRALP